MLWVGERLIISSGVLAAASTLFFAKPVSICDFGARRKCAAALICTAPLVELLIAGNDAMWPIDLLSRPLIMHFTQSGEKALPPRSVRRRLRSFEQLESRLLMAVTQDVNGWTVVTPSADSRIVYVSNSTGNDANNGLTPETAKKTIASGMSLLRNGMPDHLLLKRGDVFTNQTLVGLKNGRNTNEPIYVSTYGVGERPQILTGTASVYDGNMNNVVLQGLYFRPHTRGLNNGTIGIGAYLTGSNRFIFEDCYIGEYTGNIILYGGFGNQIRRNVITDAYGPQAVFTTGIYTNLTTNLLVEDNVFDHNGWNANVSGAVGTVFNHAIYFDGDAAGTHTLRGNIFSQSPSSAVKIIQQDGAFIVTENVFMRNGYDAQFGGSDDPAVHPIRGLIFTIENNSFIEQTDANGGVHGHGPRISNVEGGTFKNNVIANRLGTNAENATLIINDENWTAAYGVHNLRIEGNKFYNTRGTVIVNRPANGTHSGIQFVGNYFQEPKVATGEPIVAIDTTTDQTFAGNTYYRAGATSNWYWSVNNSLSFAQWKSQREPSAVQQNSQFFDPTRTTVTYAASLGLTSFNSLMVEMRKQSRTNWRTEYTAAALNAYIQGGFAIDNIGVDPLPSPQIGPPVIAPPPPAPIVQPDSGAGSAMDPGASASLATSSVGVTTQLVSSGSSTTVESGASQTNSLSQLLLARRSRGYTFASPVIRQSMVDTRSDDLAVSKVVDESQSFQEQSPLSNLARERVFAGFANARRRR